jgi:hypothetical protein
MNILITGIDNLSCKGSDKMSRLSANLESMFASVM